MNESASKRELGIAFLFLFSVCLLNIFRIKDTDTWMHLSIGKMIWNLKGIPAREPMFYATPNGPFYYSSWLFGVIYYLIYSAFSFYGAILLKALTVTAAFYIMLKDSLRPHRNLIVSVAVLTSVVYLAKYRFVERPDTILMVAISCNIYFINLYLSLGKKYIYSLPLINMLWANFHSSINLQLVIFPAFILGGLVSVRLRKTGERYGDAASFMQIKTLVLVFAASFAASLINPFFLKQYFYGATVLSTSWARHNVLELNKPVWPLNKSPFILPAVVLGTFLLGRKRMSLSHLFLVIPFMLLPFSARRFMFLTGIVSGPVMARNISSWLDAKPFAGILRGRAVAASVALCLVLFTFFAVFMDDPQNNEKKVPGFGINYDVVPEGALKFMDREGIKGRVFNAMQFGGYINWRDIPERNVFIDPRFHLPEDLLNKMVSATQKADLLNELQSAYGFDSILLASPARMRTSLLTDAFEDRDAVLDNPKWALVYWDDFSLLYVRKGGAYDRVISSNAYRFVRPAEFYGFDRGRLHDRSYLDNVLGELKRNAAVTGSSKANYMLGLLFREIGNEKAALDAFTSALAGSPRNLSDIYEGMGCALAGLARFDEAVQYFRKAIDIEKKPSTVYRLGLSYLGKGDRKKAIQYIDKAVQLNPFLASACNYLSAVNQEEGRKTDLDRVAGLCNIAANSQASDKNFRNAGASYAEGRLDTAYMQFEKAIAANPDNPGLYSALGYVAYDMGMIEKAYDLQKMALDIDPDYADAHYGLGLIARKWGDRGSASSHWNIFLRLQPKGRFSDKAREELKTL